MERSVLAELERAELASQERRLAARTEADRRLEAARAEADAIRAGAPARIDAALSELRASVDLAADREIEAIERDLETLGPEATARAGDGFDEAVQLVVAAVLGEREA